MDREVPQNSSLLSGILAPDTSCPTLLPVRRPALKLRDPWCSTWVSGLGPGLTLEVVRWTAVRPTLFLFPPRWACAVLLKSSISSSLCPDLVSCLDQSGGKVIQALSPHRVGAGLPHPTTFLLKVQTHWRTKRGDPSHMQVVLRGVLGPCSWSGLKVPVGQYVSSGQEQSREPEEPLDHERSAGDSLGPGPEQALTSWRRGSPTWGPCPEESGPCRLGSQSLTSRGSPVTQMVKNLPTV